MDSPRVGWAGLGFPPELCLDSLEGGLSSRFGAGPWTPGSFVIIPTNSPEAILGLWRDCGLAAILLAPRLAARVAAARGLPFSGGDDEAAILCGDGRCERVLGLGSVVLPGRSSAQAAGSAGREARIAFIGPMASGKSSVGRAFAAISGLPFFDSDAEIEAETGASIPAIFAAEGEDGFRALESRILARLLSGPPAVVATGGGAVLSPGNRRLLSASGEVVWLHAPPSVLGARAGGGEGRPLLSGGDPAARLAEIYRGRLPLYRSIANWLVPSDESGPSRIAEVLHDEIVFSR